MSSPDEMSSSSRVRTLSLCLHRPRPLAQLLLLKVAPVEEVAWSFVAPLGSWHEAVSWSAALWSMQ